MEFSIRILFMIVLAMIVAIIIIALLTGMVGQAGGAWENVVGWVNATLGIG